MFEIGHMVHFTAYWPWRMNLSLTSANLTQVAINATFAWCALAQIAAMGSANSLLFNETKQKKQQKFDLFFMSTSIEQIAQQPKLVTNKYFIETLIIRIEKLSETFDCDLNHLSVDNIINSKQFFSKVEQQYFTNKLQNVQIVKYFQFAVSHHLLRQAHN